MDIANKVVAAFHVARIRSSSAQVGELDVSLRSLSPKITLSKTSIE